MRWIITQKSFRPAETVDLPLYLECVFHRNSSFGILQVGGDPTDITSTLLRIAPADGSHSPLFSSMVHTTASAKAIVDADIVLTELSARVHLKIIIIEEDLNEQNFGYATIDSVALSDCILVADKQKLQNWICGHSSVVQPPRP